MTDRQAKNSHQAISAGSVLEQKNQKIVGGKLKPRFSDVFHGSCSAIFIQTWNFITVQSYCFNKLSQKWWVLRNNGQKPTILFCIFQKISEIVGTQFRPFSGFVYNCLLWWAFTLTKKAQKLCCISETETNHETVVYAKYRPKLHQVFKCEKSSQLYTVWNASIFVAHWMPLASVHGQS